MSGIVVSASTIKAKATSLTIQCRGCRSTMPNISVKPGLEGYALPRTCTAYVSTKKTDYLNKVDFYKHSQINSLLFFPLFMRIEIHRAE